MVRAAEVEDGVIWPNGVVGALGLSAEWCRGPRPARIFSRRARSLVATSVVIGATRAPAFGDGILAVAKRGQMTGGTGDSLDQESQLETGVISDRIRASDAYAPEQPVSLPSSQSEGGARA